MDDAKRWWEKAAEDFDTAEFNRKNVKFPYAAFLYQQAVEKGLKALLIKKGLGVIQTHDCFVLAKRAKAPKNIAEKADLLSAYYFRTRYPDAAPVEIEETDIEYIQSAAKEVLEWIRKQL